MTNKELLDELMDIVKLPTYYRNKFPENCGYFNGSKYGFDCVCLIKCALSGWKPSTAKGSYLSPAKFVCGDISEAQMLASCKTRGKDFSKIPAPGALLYMPGHVGVYVGPYMLLDGRVVNSIECTTSYKANGVTWSYCDPDGTRRPYKGGPASKKWTEWGLLEKWVSYDGLVFPPDIAKPTLRKGSKGLEVVKLQHNLIDMGFSLPKYGADGDYGAETKYAVTCMQKKSFPTEPKEWDGIYGPKTAAKVKEFYKA